VTANEFYQIDQAVPTPRIDTADLNLIQSYSSWSSAVSANYADLQSELASILASQPPCPGDGNIDASVNSLDAGKWKMLSVTWGLSSVYDFNLDGVTDGADLAIINGNLGTCKKSSSVY
jgi:hypothetical protein